MNPTRRSQRHWENPPPKPLPVLLLWLVQVVLVVVVVIVLPSSRTKVLSFRLSAPCVIRRAGGLVRVVTTSVRLYHPDSNEPEEDDDDDPTSSSSRETDWRSFRAQLVMQEKKEQEINTGTTSSSSTTEDDNLDLDGIGSLFGTTTNTNNTNHHPLAPNSSFSSWAYESGKLIEQGAIILGGVEQDFGFALRQQYFHKAVILVLEHTPSFTKGIILNRPSDRQVQVSSSNSNNNTLWNIWYGGDVQGFSSDKPDIVCLHTLTHPQIRQASITLMNDLQWTTFSNAQKMVQDQLAQPNQFWLFCGYAGWGPTQLEGELDRQSWYMLATDSNTILKELKRLADQGADPREAGIETWDLLMRMIGKTETAQQYAGGFDDLMLKEWAFQNLLHQQTFLSVADDGKLRTTPLSQDPPIQSTPELPNDIDDDPIDKLIGRLSALARYQDVTEGMLVRASSKERSPWLLEGQEYHKSIILVLKDNDEISIGAMLNRPAAQGIDIQMTDNSTGESKRIQIPLRFGGQFAVKGTEPLLWLHSKSELKRAKIGSPFVSRPEGIWKCTSKDITQAIESGIATPSDFMVVSGVTVWTKGDKGLARGIQGEIKKGTFEVVPFEKTQAVWDILTKQELLTASNLVQNLAIGNEAWAQGALGDKKQEATPLPMTGLGENYDEEDDSIVFKSDVKVSQLSDDALRTWVATFLLGSPSLGG